MNLLNQTTTAQANLRMQVIRIDTLVGTLCAAPQMAGGLAPPQQLRVLKALLERCLDCVPTCLCLHQQGVVSVACVVVQKYRQEVQLLALQETSICGVFLEPDEPHPVRPLKRWRHERAVEPRGGR